MWYDDRFECNYSVFLKSAEKRYIMRLKSSIESK